MANISGRDRPAKRQPELFWVNYEVQLTQNSARLWTRFADLPRVRLTQVLPCLGSRARINFRFEKRRPTTMRDSLGELPMQVGRSPTSMTASTRPEATLNIHTLLSLNL